MTDLSPKIIADPARYPDWCTCGRNHPTMETMVVSDDLAYDALAGDCRREFGDRAVLLLDDDNTRAVAGEDIRAALRRCGLAPDDLTLPGTVSADDRAVNRVRQTAQNCELIIAVGSGTINDLAKAAAWDLGLPYWVAPTAPSMNGYTSSVAAIKVSGVKLTLPAGPPKRIYAPARGDRRGSGPAALVRLLRPDRQVRLRHRLANGFLPVLRFLLRTALPDGRFPGRRLPDPAGDDRRRRIKRP